MEAVEGHPRAVKSRATDLANESGRRPDRFFLLPPASVVSEVRCAPRELIRQPFERSRDRSSVRSNVSTVRLELELEEELTRR